MKSTPPVLVILPVAAALAAGVALAGPLQDPAKGYPSASPSGSASALPPEPKPELVAGRKPWLPAFDVAIPETPSDAPTKEEWASAAPAPEARVTQAGITVTRVREWYRITSTFHPWIGMISGTRDGVSFGCAKKKREDTNCDTVWVQFPARRGDSRAFQLFSWGKWGPSPDAIITEQLIEGDRAPLISVQGSRWGF